MRSLLPLLMHLGFPSLLALKWSQSSNEIKGLGLLPILVSFPAAFSLLKTNLSLPRFSVMLVSLWLGILLIWSILQCFFPYYLPICGTHSPQMPTSVCSLLTALSIFNSWWISLAPIPLLLGNCVFPKSMFPTSRLTTKSHITSIAAAHHSQLPAWCPARHGPLTPSALVN